MGLIEGENEDIVLIDVTPMSLGISKVGDLMSVIIDKNTPIPCSASKMFYSTFDGQAYAEVEIFEGEKTMVKDNNRLGAFTITGM